MSLDVGAAYEAHADPIWRYLCRRLNGDRDAADEVAGRSWLHVLERAHQYEARPGVPLSAWLFRIAHNLAVDYVKSEQSRRRWLGPVSLEERSSLGHEDAVADDSSVLEQERLETRDELLVLLAHAEQRQQDVIRLRFLGDLSTIETRDALGLPSTSAVTKLQHRGLARMRQAAERDSKQAV